MTDVTDAITQAARENGIDPSTALAFADRESSLNPNEWAKCEPGVKCTAYGLFQLRESERKQYGGSSSDPYDQASAWGRYIQGTRNDMRRILGRDPTGTELYLGHYWGGPRAARIVNGTIPADTPVTDVWSPNELRANHDIRDAGTVGNITSRVTADVNRRIAKYGGLVDPMAGVQFPSTPSGNISLGESDVPFTGGATADASSKPSAVPQPPTQNEPEPSSVAHPLNPAVPGPPQVPGV